MICRRRFGPKETVVFRSNCASPLVSAHWSGVNPSILRSELSGACHSAASAENGQKARAANQKNG
jgi:hypothetical protein